MSEIPIAEIEQAIRKDVCHVCRRNVQVPSDPGVCRFERDRSCPVFAKLEAVVGSISAVESPMLDPYVNQLRGDVCAHCSHLDENEVCDICDSDDPTLDWCILNSYFPLIVGAVERVRKAHLNS